ncbi:hypothetical protein CPB83DRAFT_841854 [Crepidotus variabilis]|uniref:Uncharacterized protein n=1 Tax=Crepidotus variabilis TaxID=179855 RepID=A0A9P6EV56_9AGAR|nr:hypothetical protein CPB83DRAFT_841854 [Crepidotus variabilis]
MARELEYLDSEQVERFLEQGYIVIKHAFSLEKANEWTKELWLRLGADPNDKSTWKTLKERTHLPWKKREKVETLAPTAWAAIKDLLGGEDRINSEASSWGDSFIVNVGTEELEDCKKHVAPQDLDNWHVDGDFFVHFLDSPEQALLVIPIYSHIEPQGGGTIIAPEGIDIIAKYLASHPEGVLPTGLSFTPSTSKYTNKEEDPGYISFLREIKKCHKFVEMTGEPGDVILLHPLMLHSASKNYLRIPRVITNPPVGLKSPFVFHRENSDDYSIVERKTLRALGKDRLDFKISTDRRQITPARVLAEQKMLQEEKRLKEAATQMVS